VRFRDQVIRTDGGTPIWQWVSGGHSGMVMVNNNGRTKYVEFGRYGGSEEKRGRVRSSPVANLKFEDGVPTEKSLKGLYKNLLQIGAKAGSKELELTIRPDADNYDAMNRESDRWDREVEYDVASRKTCHDFCRMVNREGGRSESTTILLTPDNIDEAIQETRDYYREQNERRNR
jgi:general stress protein YciG